MKRQTEDGYDGEEQPQGSAAVTTSREDSGQSRRTFLKKGLKGAALLPYVPPLIQTFAISEAEAQASPPPPPPPPDPPTITYISPDNGDPNDTFDLYIYGTDFVDTPNVTIPDKVKENSVTFVSDTGLIVNITIRSAAAPGPRNVKVKNPDNQSDTLVNGFTVNVPPPPPTVTACIPDNGDKDTTIDVPIVGSDFVATPTVKIPSKVVENSVTFVSSNEISVNITIKKRAAPGPRDVRVINPDSQDDTLVGGFTVNLDALGSLYSIEVQ